MKTIIIAAIAAITLSSTATAQELEGAEEVIQTCEAFARTVGDAYVAVINEPTFGANQALRMIMEKFAPFADDRLELVPATKIGITAIYSDYADVYHAGITAREFTDDVFLFCMRGESEEVYPS